MKYKPALAKMSSKIRSSNTAKEVKRARISRKITQAKLHQDKSLNQPHMAKSPLKNRSLIKPQMPAPRFTTIPSHKTIPLYLNNRSISPNLAVPSFPLFPTFS